MPHQWQGRYRSLCVIGDKQGGGTALRLRARPYLLDRLRRTVEVPVKLVHIVRNPYDNISTIARKHHMPLTDSIDFYFSLCETIQMTKPRGEPADWFEMQKVQRQLELYPFLQVYTCEA